MREPGGRECLPDATVGVDADGEHEEAERCQRRALPSGVGGALAAMVAVVLGGAAGLARVQTREHRVAVDTIIDNLSLSMVRVPSGKLLLQYEGLQWLAWCHNRFAIYSGQRSLASWGDA